MKPILRFICRVLHIIFYIALIVIDAIYISLSPILVLFYYIFYGGILFDKDILEQIYKINKFFIYPLCRFENFIDDMDDLKINVFNNSFWR